MISIWPFDFEPYIYLGLDAFTLK